jgi:putative hydrolase of the HAD superfamily
MSSIEDTVTFFSFDFWGTIVRPNPDFAQARNAMVYQALGCEEEGIPITSFSTIFQQAKQETEALSEGQGRHVGFEERLGALCWRLGINFPPSKTIGGIRDGHHALSTEYPADLFSDGIGALLRDILTDGKTVGLISNTGMLDGSDINHLLELHDIDDCFSYKIFSNETGVAKPNPQAFYSLTAQAGITTESVVHIGDNRRADYEGALSAGMTAIHASLDLDGIHQVKRYLS